MKIYKILPIVGLLYFNNCVGADKNNEKVNYSPTDRKDIYLQYDKEQKPFYVISKKIVPDSLLRIRLGKALVTIYMGKKWWTEGESVFKDADSIGVRVLLVASNLIENDDGTAAFVLRSLGAKGCDAMIESLKKAQENKESVNKYYIDELGNAVYGDATGVLLLLLNNSKVMPEARVSSAIALSKIGNYTGLDVLKKMRDEKTSVSWHKWIDRNILIIENTKQKQEATPRP